MRVITGQIIDVRKRLLRRTVADSVSLLQAREQSKGALLRLGGHARRVIDELAGRLVERGLLEQPGQIELLSRDELTDAVGGRGPSLDELIRRRSALAAAHRGGPLPEVFTGAAPKAQAEDRDGDVLHGWAASPGTHTGTVRVLDSPKRGRLAEGEVLVASGTDPSWTPLFLRAGAIVVDAVVRYSHAAILARELGLPAVLNAKGAVARLSDVRAVRVDGSAGTVEDHRRRVPQRRPGRPRSRGCRDDPVRPRWSTLDPGPQHAGDRHVFVPMVLGAGIIVSVVLLLSDTVAALRGKHHDRLRARRRSLLVARPRRAGRPGRASARHPPTRAWHLLADRRGHHGVRGLRARRRDMELLGSLSAGAVVGGSGLALAGHLALWAGGTGRRCRGAAPGHSPSQLHHPAAALGARQPARSAQRRSRRRRRSDHELLAPRAVAPALPPAHPTPVVGAAAQQAVAGRCHRRRGRARGWRPRSPTTPSSGSIAPCRSSSATSRGSSASDG